MIKLLKKYTIKLGTFILSVLMLAYSVSAASIDDTVLGILDYWKGEYGGLQAKLDCAIEDGEGSGWYVLSLASIRESDALWANIGACGIGALDFDTYADSLEAYIAEHPKEPASTRLRHAITLFALGRGDSPIVSDIANTDIGRQGVMSRIFGLHLLNCGIKCEAYTPESLAEELISLRLADGGWALRGEVSDTDITSMALQALAPFADSYGEIIEGALDLIASRRLDDGGFFAYGVSNAESAAQVILALTALGIDPDADARFEGTLEALLAFRCESGGFRHTTGGNVSTPATYQSLMALVSLMKLRLGEGRFYDFDGRLDAVPEVSETSAAEEVTVTEAITETEAISETERTNPEPDTEKSGGIGIKGIIIAVILALAVIAAVVMLILGRRGVKNYIFIAASAVILSALVLILDIETREDYYGTDEGSFDGFVTFSVTCDVIEAEGNAHIPEDGVILDPREIGFSSGESIFDILTRACRENEIQLDASAGYIRGLAYIYEFDFGDLSGWVYYINGERPSISSADYEVKDGDVIEWRYSLELGRDLE